MKKKKYRQKKKVVDEKKREKKKMSFAQRFFIKSKKMEVVSFLGRMGFFLILKVKHFFSSRGGSSPLVFLIRKQTPCLLCFFCFIH